jgi:O-antigen ligase
VRRSSQSGNGQAAIPSSERSATLLDAVGAGLFATVASLIVWARMSSGGSAAPVLALLAACGLVIVFARAVGPLGRLIVPAAGVLAAILVVAASRTSVVSTHPLSGPFGYLNADGAFYVQAAIAGLMLATSHNSRPIRVIGGTVAAAFAVLPFVIHSLAAAILVLLLPGTALGLTALWRAKGARACIAVLAAMFVTALGSTILLGATYSPQTEPTRLERAVFATVDRERVALWHDAFVIMREHPRTGIGPGRYQAVSPIAVRYPDFRWAHNEFLQQGAEGGVASLVLLVALFGWGFVRLWLVRAPDATTALAAASLAALAIHACVDYVMHFPAIPMIAVALVATGMIDGAVPAPARGIEPRLEHDDFEQERSRT